jgi:hypothetical protein
MLTSRGGRDSCPEFIESSRVEKRDGLYNFSIFHLEVPGFPHDEKPVSQALSDLGGGLLPDSPLFGSPNALVEFTKDIR